MSEKYSRFWDRVRAETNPGLSNSQKAVARMREEEARQKPIKEREIYDRFSYLIGKKVTVFNGLYLTPKLDLNQTLVLTIKDIIVRMGEAGFSGEDPISKYDYLDFVVDYEGVEYKLLFTPYNCNYLDSRFLKDDGTEITPKKYTAKTWVNRCAPIGVKHIYEYKERDYRYPTEDQFG